MREDIQSTRQVYVYSPHPATTYRHVVDGLTNELRSQMARRVGMPYTPTENDPLGQENVRQEMINVAREYLRRHHLMQRVRSLHVTQDGDGQYQISLSMQQVSDLISPDAAPDIVASLASDNTQPRLTDGQYDWYLNDDNTYYFNTIFDIPSWMSWMLCFADSPLEGYRVNSTHIRGSRFRSGSIGVRLRLRQPPRPRVGCLYRC